MKYYLAIIITLFLCACGAGSKSVIAPFNSFTLKVNEKAAYGNMVITLKEVRESRCPVNANCIRAGEAVAVLNVVVDDKSERNIQLCAGPDCSQQAISESYLFAVENQKYLFKLDSITPDPSKAPGPAEKKVYFSISQPK